MPASRIGSEESGLSNVALGQPIALGRIALSMTRTKHQTTHADGAECRMDLIDDSEAAKRFRVFWLRSVPVAGHVIHG